MVVIIASSCGAWSAGTEDGIWIAKTSEKRSRTSCGKVCGSNVSNILERQKGSGSGGIYRTRRRRRRNQRGRRKRGRTMVPSSLALLPPFTFPSNSNDPTMVNSSTSNSSNYNLCYFHRKEITRLRVELLHFVDNSYPQERHQQQLQYNQLSSK